MLITKQHVFIASNIDEPTSLIGYNNGTGFYCIRQYKSSYTALHCLFLFTFLAANLALSTFTLH